MSAFGERLWDDSIFTPPGQPRPKPQLVFSLLTRLRLTRATRAEKEAGIREWLSTHKPTEHFLRDLEREGLLHLLPDSRP